MVYKLVSSREVVARFIRNSRISDSSYFDDMDEWMVEASRKLKTKYQVLPVQQVLTVEGHVAKMPCDILYLKCITFNGYRLKIGSDERSISAVCGTTYPAVMGYSYREQKTVTISEDGLTESDLNYYLYGVDLLAYDERNFYNVAGNYLQFSFPSGQVVLHYTKAPRDSEGFWEIPDNEDYKEACYWYLRSKLIGVGWEDPNPRNTEDTCYVKFELFGARALEQITYPSPDRMRNISEQQNRMIPPMNYWEAFFNNPNE